MKKAIVVGATSGIGKELAILLANNNYKVGITGRRIEKLQEIENSNPEAFISKYFNCTLDNNSKKLEELVNELGGLDLLVMSSGVGNINEGLDFDIEQTTVALNVVAFTEIMTWAYNYFESQSYGHIVGISSVGGLRGSRFAPAYNASKSYQINYLEGLRQKAQHSKSQIQITDIRPGFVDTAMAKGDGQFWVASKEKAAKQILSHIEKNKNIGYVTKRWRLIASLLMAIPNWLYTRL